MAGVCAVPHIGVAHQGDIGGERLLVGGDEAGRVDRAGFLLALQQEGDVDGQRAGDREISPAGLDEGHDLALVVGGAAPDEALLAVGALDQRRLEGRRGPQVQRIDRLHVVMAVEHHPLLRAEVAARGDDGVARRLVELRLEAQRSEVVGQPLAGAPALGGVSPVGGDGGDAQQREQPFQAAVEIGIHRCQHAVEIGHGRIPSSVFSLSPHARA